MKLLDLKASPVLRFLTGRKRQPAEPAYSEDTLNAIRSLISSQDWRLYKLMLDMKVSEAVQGLLGTHEDSHVHYLRGYAQGLLNAAQIPEDIIQRIDNATHRSDKLSAAALRRDSAAKSALFATAHWDA